MMEVSETNERQLTLWLRDLKDRIEAGESLILLQTDDEPRGVEAVAQLARELARPLQMWSLSTGLLPVAAQAENSTEGQTGQESTPVEFLEQIRRDAGQGLFLAKDLQYFLHEAAVVRRLQDAAQTFFGSPLLLIASEYALPPALAKVVTILRIPLPDFGELADCLEATLGELSEPLEISAAFRERMVKSVLGLSRQQARRAFHRVLLGRTDVGEEVMTQLVSEKKQLLQGTDLLEFHELGESEDDIGGLDGLKDWINRRSKAYSPEARARNVGQPKGVLLLGVQGCGKSLSARVIARQLSFPLVRLDFGNLLQGERGVSEQNLREVLRMMDGIAPAVLWIEELDKGFSGLEAEDDNRDAVLARMFGLFLTWMQEHTTPIFVVATANAIENLPPELLRRGRFDELFFIDLPNFHERQHIFRIHLSKRHCNPEEYNLEELSDKTEGYSGAEIEQIVNSAVIDAYTRDRQATMKDLMDTADTIVPLSVTMEEKVFTLREWARSRCRPATPDSRVMRMLEDEQRKGELSPDDNEFDDPWLELLRGGDLSGAILEFVRANDQVTFPKLVKAFEPHISTEGSAVLALESDPLVILWQGLDPTFADAIARYVNGKRFFLNPVDVSHYQKLGRVLKLPYIPQLKEKAMPREVWFPCVLRIMPPREGSGRLRSIVSLHEG